MGQKRGSNNKRGAVAARQNHTKHSAELEYLSEKAAIPYPRNQGHRRRSSLLYRYGTD